MFRNQATFLRNDGRLNLEKMEACYQQTMQAMNEGVQNVTSPGDKMSPHIQSYKEIQ